MSEKLSRRGEGGSSASNGAERKQSLYFKGSTLQDMKEQAARLDRSLSWVVQRAWAIAKSDIAALPSMSDAEGTTEETDVDLAD